MTPIDIEDYGKLNIKYQTALASAARWRGYAGRLVKAMRESPYEIHYRPLLDEVKKALEETK